MGRTTESNREIGIRRWQAGIPTGLALGLLDDAIANFDGVTTYYTSGGPDEAGNHNFFFYEESATRYTIIPWDLESTLSLSSGFGNVPNWQSVPADCATTYLAWGGPLRVIAPGCNRVFHALATDLTGYRAAAATLIEGPFAESTMLAKIDSLASFIRSAASADPHGPGATGFENGVGILRKEIPALRRRLTHLLSGQPMIPTEIAVGAVNDFEKVDDYGLSTGSTCLANPHTTANPTVNQSDPLSGTKTLRIVFDFGDEAAAWQQWMFYRVPFADGINDLSALTGIRMKVRSNERRVLRLDVDSPKNSKINEGIAMGWNISVGVETSTVSIAFADAQIPSWAAAPGDNLSDVLRNATALMFRPQCNHLDGTGHLPAGVTDDGWVDIDDLEVF